MVMPGHLVGFGGMVGAVLRHVVSEAVARESFPVGTLTVNVVGSFVLGFVTFLSADNDVLLFVGTGACGSFTTFSSFSYDTVGLWEEGKRDEAVAFALANVIGAVFAIGLAWLVVP